MKIAMIGAPGSGKSHLAKIIAETLSIPHIQSDIIFWNGGDLRQEVQEMVLGPKWIFEGHISKLSDIVLPRADKIIVIEDLKLRSLFRAIKRDWKNVSKAWYIIQNYEKLASRRQSLVDELKITRLESLLYLNNYPDLSRKEIESFCFKAFPLIS